MLTPSPTLPPAPPLPTRPELVEITPPARPPWWAKWLERKFILTLLASGSGILALFSGAVPVSWEVVSWILAPVLAWLGVESGLDFSRLKIADVPGRSDDLARLLQRVGQAGQEAPPSVQTSAPTDKGSAGSWFAVVLALAVAAVALFAWPVVAAQTSFPVSRTLPYNESSTGTSGRVSVVSTSTGTTVLAADTGRRGLCVQNTGPVLLYCKRGTTVSATDYAVILEPNAAAANDRGGQAWCLDGWGGAVRCLAASGTGLVGVDAF